MMAPGGNMGWNADRIQALLGPWAQRVELAILPECDSSNSRLMAEAEAGAASGRVILCERQTAGRGRRGRSWLAPPGGSLAFSLLWRLPPHAPPPMGLSLAVGLAVAQALEESGAVGIGLKWPNDILLHGRKLGGILVELSSGRQGLALVIGIGLNLCLPADFPYLPDLSYGRPADLAEALVDAPLPEENALFACLLRHLIQVLDRFNTGGFAGLRQDWLARHAFQDLEVRLSSDHGAPVDGHCLGVADDGALLLRLADGGVARILAGEVSLRLARP